ncbi:MAG: plasmid mobilization protein [Dyadobacter fermentans]
MKEVESMEQKSNKSRGGRPPKKVKRNAQLMVRLSETERFLIESKARESGLRPSTWMRQAAKKARVVARLSAEEAGFIRMLAGLANNLNQLLRFTNMQGLLHETKKAAELLSNIDHLLKRLTKDDR